MILRAVTSRSSESKEPTVASQVRNFREKMPKMWFSCLNNHHSALLMPFFQVYTGFNGTMRQLYDPPLADMRWASDPGIDEFSYEPILDPVSPPQQPTFFQEPGLFVFVCYRLHIMCATTFMHRSMHAIWRQHQRDTNNATLCNMTWLLPFRHIPAMSAWTRRLQLLLLRHRRWPSAVHEHCWWRVQSIRRFDDVVQWWRRNRVDAYDIGRLRHWLSSSGYELQLPCTHIRLKYHSVQRIAN